MSTLAERTSRPAGHLLGPPRTFGVLLLVLAAALLVNSAVGPLGVGLVDYSLSESLLNQLIGLELVTVGLVAPWCAWAGVRALRGLPDAPLLAFGPVSYTLYMFIQYVLGPEYGDYSAVVLFHVGLVTLSGGLTLWAWSLSRVRPAPERPVSDERLLAGAMFGLALFVVLRYAGALAGSFSGAAIPEEFADARTFYWSIFLLDLGVVVPATVVGAIALARGRQLGRRALCAAAGWFALVPPSVAAMAATMLVRDDPNASLVSVIILTVASILFAVFALAAHRPLLPATAHQ